MEPTPAPVDMRALNRSSYVSFEHVPSDSLMTAILVRKLCEEQLQSKTSSQKDYRK